MVGLGFRFGGVGPVLIYDTAVILENLREQGMAEEGEAEEFAEFNIYGLWAGEGTPIFLERSSYAEIEERLVAADSEA